MDPLCDKYEQVPIVSYVWRRKDQRRTEENGIGRELMSTSDAIAIAADNLSHDEMEKMSCAPHETHDSIVVASLRRSAEELCRQSGEVLQSLLDSRDAHANVYS